MTIWCRFRGQQWVTFGAVLLSVSVGLAQEHAASPREFRHAEARVKRGSITVQVGWVIDPVTSLDALRGRIEFRPDPNRGSSCSSIRFIQVAKVEQSGGRDLNWSMGEANRNLIRTASGRHTGIEGGYFVDHEAFRCMKGQPCSPYFRDSWPNPDESQDGFQLGIATAPASLVDYPFGWDSIEQITVESCARCLDTGSFLGCAKWGGRWPARGPRDILAIKVHEVPSLTFLAALRRFEVFYSGRKP